MSVYKPYRNCPICNNAKVNSLHQVQFVLFDNHPIDTGYDVVQCETCSFVYADTKVTQDELDYYYKELSKYENKDIGTGGGYTKNDKERLIETAEFISAYLPDKNARIIDLGCANGGMLKELKNLGYNNIVGLDPSEACVEITKTEVGCDAYQMSLFAVGEGLGKFDLVILSHVLEHLLELSSALNTLDQLTKEGGMVYVECPNALNYNKVIHAPLQEFNTEHINHFTEVSFENLFGLNGYEKTITGNKIMKIASDQDYHAVYGLFQKRQSASKYNLKHDDEICESILDYILKSEKIFKAIFEKLSAIDTAQSIAFFGIGQFAFKLLARLPLKKYEDVRLFDNNSLNVGKTINGINILPGKSIFAEYTKSPFVIVITSLIHENGIRKQLEAEFATRSIDSPTIIGFQNCLNL